MTAEGLNEDDAPVDPGIYGRGFPHARRDGIANNYETTSAMDRRQETIAKGNVACEMPFR